MTRLSEQPSSQSFQSLFQSALEEYQKKTGIDLVRHPLASQLEHCNDVEAITEVLQGQAQAFCEFRGSNKRLIKSLKYTVQALHKLSGLAVLVKDIGIPIPIVKTIHTCFGALLGVARDVSASYDTLTEALETMCSFLKRLEIYIEARTTPMAEKLVKILVQFLVLLAVVTKQVKQGRLRKFFKNLIRSDSEIGTERHKLDRLIDEETREAVALTFKVANGNSSERLRQEIQRWLSPPDHCMRYNIGREARHEETGKWLIEGETFAEWKSSSNSILWIHGKPGSGKSTLSSTIIENIDCMCKDGPDSLAFYYFDFSDTEKNHVRGLLTSLLWQLCDQSDSYWDIICQFHLAQQDGKKLPSDRELSLCLKDMLCSPGQVPVYFIFDALDECPNSSGTPSNRENVLLLVKNLIDLRLPNLHICLTSRPEVDIRAVLDRSEVRTICLHDEEGQKQDILDYIRSIVHTDPMTRQWKAEVKELAIEVLSQKANGMFRWVFCQFDFLRRCDPETIPRVLDNLPATLDATYDRTLLDIGDQNWEHAYLLFQCVAVALRPLRVEELAEFLAFDFQAGPIPEFDEDLRRKDPVSAILSKCSSLFFIVNTGDSNVIQFSHSSVKEYLTSSRIAQANSISLRRYHISIRHAHAITARACLGILLHMDEDVTAISLQRFPLAEYAAEYWIDHARFEDVSRDVEDGMKQLFDPRRPHLAIWVWIHEPDVPLWDREDERTERPPLPRATPLHYAALCGFHTIVISLIREHLQDVQALGFDDESTPLHSASFGGHVDIALALLKNGADVNAETFDHYTPLHAASSEGHVELTRMLLEYGADVMALTEDAETPLHIASRGGYVEVVGILLEYGVDPKAKDDHEETPLVQALRRGNQEVAHILSERLRVIDNANGQCHQAPKGWTPSLDGEDESDVEMDMDWIPS